MDDNGNDKRLGWELPPDFPDELVEVERTIATQTVIARRIDVAEQPNPDVGMWISGSGWG